MSKEAEYAKNLLAPTPYTNCEYCRHNDDKEWSHGALLPQCKLDNHDEKRILGLCADYEFEFHFGPYHKMYLNTNKN